MSGRQREVDTRRERYIAALVANEAGYSYKITTQFASFDACFYTYDFKSQERVVVEVAEIKAREMCHDKFPRGIFLDYIKLAALSSHMDMRPEVYFVIGCYDGIFKAILTRARISSLDIALEGRKGRDDKYDIEPVGLIPVEWFIKCSEVYNLREIVE